MTAVTLANGNVHSMGAGLTGTGAGPWCYKESPNAAIQVNLSSANAGALTATVVLEVSNDGVNPCATVAGTITLGATAPAVGSDGFTFQNAGWKFVRLNVTAISGTGATVTGFLGT